VVEVLLYLISHQDYLEIKQPEDPRIIANTINDILSYYTSLSLEIISIPQLLTVLGELESKGYIDIISINGNNPTKYNKQMPFVDIFDVGPDKNSIIFIRDINLLEARKNPIQEIYVFQDKYTTKLIVIGKTKNKIVHPNTNELGSNIWVSGLSALAKASCLELSSELMSNDDRKIKALLTINNQPKLALYANGFFDLTSIIKKSEDRITKNIPIKIIDTKECFEKKEKN
ncbi:MAG: hypothetical protein PHF05_08350, partial [Candidatus Izemoplasmatales bacterium]|nr:hypothetical protein [Candidatus Izemoplasmatales bacterium]